MVKKTTFTNKSGKEFEVLEIIGKNSKFPYRVGKTKAKLIIENFEEIRKFAAE